MMAAVFDLKDVKTVFQQMMAADNTIPYALPAEMVGMLAGFNVSTSIEKVTQLYKQIGLEDDMSII